MAAKSRHQQAIETRIAHLERQLEDAKANVKGYEEELFSLKAVMNLADSMKQEEAPSP